ncbi:MAG: hypothetical protein U1F11_14415 [Steroidobacteraceae bacterium]
MSFALHRRAPGLRADGETAAVLAAAGSAVTTRLDALGARPPALRVLLDALATAVPLPPPAKATRRSVVGTRRTAATGDIVAAAEAALPTALAELRRELYSAAAWPQEMTLAWREAVATGWLAGAIARMTGGSPGTAGIAGLLHGADEALVLQALADGADPRLTGLDAASRRECCADHAPEALARLVRAWRLAPGVATALATWRRAPELQSAGGADARAVYWAHMLASQVVLAEFPAPGLDESLRSELRLDRRELQLLQELVHGLRPSVLAL